MNTPNHATDAQIDALWRMLQLDTARNFAHAYREHAQQIDEREKYTGSDPRNNKGAKIK